MINIQHQKNIDKDKRNNFYLYNTFKNKPVIASMMNSKSNCKDN